MADTTYVDGVTLVTADTMNDLNRLHYTIFGDPATVSAAKATLLADGQIPFPATQNPSADANTLDDYEEGTWTPVLTFATPGNLSVAYSTQVGTYTKVGRAVHLNFNIVTSTFTHTTASGALNITGVPFAHQNVTGDISWGSGRVSGVTKTGYTDFNYYIQYNTSIVALSADGSGQTYSGVEATDMPTGGSVVIRGSITYFSA